MQSEFPGWSLVEVRGKHRKRFLNSQLTSDVAGLDVGRSQLSASLDRSGRLQAFFFVLERKDGLDLLVPAEAARNLIEHLERHVIADDVSFRPSDVGAMRIALGPEAEQRMHELPFEQVYPVEAYGSRGFVTWTDRRLTFDLIADHDLEALRVLTGLPRWGVEARHGQLVTETTLVETAVSAAKGCYLGQETVAKVASHRGAARYPVLLETDAALDPGLLIGRTFAIGDRPRAGTVLSYARRDGRLYVQASLLRDFRVDGLDIRCILDDGVELAGTVAALPLVRVRSAAETAEDLYHRAVAEFAADREAEAMELLERAISVCPGHADSFESLGVILGRHGRYDEAIALMERLLEVDPDSVMAHTNMSVYHNQLGRIEDAEREARAAAVKSAELKRRERERASAEKRSHEQAGVELERREQMFRQVLELDPDDALGNFGMGELCIETGRLETAIRHLQKAIEADPSYSAAYLALGRAWEVSDRPDRARDVFATGIDVAARRGDLATANKMKERLAVLEDHGAAAASG